MDENIQFQNMDSWRSGGSSRFGLTFKQIILQHINRCVQNGSTEWHGGYYNSTGNNPVTQTYVQNSRDVYSNSVKMLRALLIGYFDKNMTDSDKKLQEEMDQEYHKYSERESAGKEIAQEWFSFKVNWHIKLFAELIMLCKRLNFFEEETSEEEM